MYVSMYVCMYVSINVYVIIIIILLSIFYLQVASSPKTCGSKPTCLEE